MNKQFSRPTIKFKGVKAVNEIAHAMMFDFEEAWTGTPGLQGDIEQVRGPLTGDRFYMARVVTRDGKALTMFASTRIEIEHKVATVADVPNRFGFRSMVNGEFVEGETWPEFRAKLREVCECTAC